MRRFSLNRLGLGGITGNKPHKPKYKNGKKKPVKDFKTYIQRIGGIRELRTTFIGNIPMYLQAIILW